MSDNLSPIHIFNSRASEYQEKFMDVGLYYDGLDEFIKRLKPNAEILELGCGPGNITQYLLQQRSGLKITGIDLAPNMLELAKKNNPTAEFLCMDVREILSLKKMYDAVICGFCLPYLNKEDTLKLLSDISSVLKPGGTLYVSTIEGKYENSGIETNSHGEQTHMYYYDSGFLVKTCRENNLTEIQQFRVKYPRGAAKVTDISIIASL